jgi:hypothetical protein
MLGMGGGSAWGAGTATPASQNTANADKNGGVKSLLDIQAEEQRAAALRKKSEPKAGGHWAALASNAPAPSAKGVWGPGRGPPAPAPRSQSAPQPNPEPPAVRSQNPVLDGWEEANGKKRSTSGGISPLPQQGQQAAASSSSSSQVPSAGNTSTKDAKAFGGPSLGGGFYTWCEEQLRRLAGSDDMTLIHFCMSLDDPAEVRSYLSAYLVSTYLPTYLQISCHVFLFLFTIRILMFY